jgi:glycosyltransferase involved in cell wall biosynthesis
MMPGKKVYVTFHGYEPGGLPKRKNKLHRKLAERMATKTVCVGDFMRGWYGQKPDRVIYGAGDAIPKLKPKGRNAVFVGRLEADTGIFAYLRALMEIKPEIYLDIYGDGPEKAEVIRIIKRNNLPAAVHGYTNKPLEKIQEARYVFTSQYLSIIQAMQTKRLVVAVYTNPLKKDYLYLHPQSKNMIIADGGKDLTEKFNSLNSIYEAEYVERAYAWAKAQTWDKVTDIYQELWHD